MTVIVESKNLDLVQKPVFSTGGRCDENSGDPPALSHNSLQMRVTVVRVFVVIVINGLYISVAILCLKLCRVVVRTSAIDCRIVYVRCRHGNRTRLCDVIGGGGSGRFLDDIV